MRSRSPTDVIPLLALAISPSLLACAAGGTGGGEESAPAPVNCPSASACVEVGSTLLDSDEVEDALLRFQRAASLETGDATIHLYLGITHSRLGHAERARAAFTRASELAPASIAATQARQWLAKLSNPTRVAVPTFLQGGDVEPSRANNYATEQLRIQLFETGLYELVQIRISRRAQMNPTAACEAATDHQVELVFIGSVTRGQQAQRMEHSLWDRLTDEPGQRVYDYYSRLTLHVYERDGCRLVSTLRGEGLVRGHPNRRTVAQEGIRLAVQELARQLHRMLN